jgi:hypothetical protein
VLLLLSFKYKDLFILHLVAMRDKNITVSQTKRVVSAKSRSKNLIWFDVVKAGLRK